MSGSFRYEGPRISFGHHNHPYSFVTGANDLRCWRTLKPQIYIHLRYFIPITESSTQWNKGFMPYGEFHYNIYINNTLILCHYETFETERLISRSLACVEWRNNGFCWANVIGSVSLYPFIIYFWYYLKYN